MKVDCTAAPAMMARDRVPVAGEDAEERRWIGRAANGDPEGFTWLLTRYRDRVVRLAAHVLRRPDEAEDVAQETFIRAFRGLRSFRGQARFYTWLYHIALRVCAERCRSARWSAEAPWPTSDCPLPAAGAHDADRLAVEALLDQLSPQARAALVLREIDGMAYDEVAAALDIPVGTVRSRLHSAKARFRALYLAAEKELRDA